MGPSLTMYTPAEMRPMASAERSKCGSAGCAKDAHGPTVAKQGDDGR